MNIMPDTPELRILSDPALTLIEFRGADALSFLQGQLSHDLATLPAGRTRLAAYCSAKGRVLGLLRVWVDADGCTALAAADLAEALLRRLSIFVLRAQVQPRSRPDLRVAGVLGADAAERLRAAGVEIAAAADGVTARPDGVVAVSLPGAVPRVVLAGAPGQIDAILDAVVAPAGPADAWTLADIRAGLPQVVSATHEQFLPHHLNLDLVDGLSFQKGCYPGQEIVARMHYRGRPTRRMLRFALAGGAVATPGETIYRAGRTEQAGEVVCAAATEHGQELLAVVQLAARGHPLALGSADGPRLDEQPLPYAVPELSGAGA